MWFTRHVQAPSEALLRAGYVLRTVLLSRSPHMIRDRKYHQRTYRRCLVGSEMIDWLMDQSAIVTSRHQAVGMWQALLEEGVVVHGEWLRRLVLEALSKTHIFLRCHAVNYILLCVHFDL